MIVSSCPLRISLAGGSTDHPHFIEKYGEGSVISFPSNLRVYVTLHRDVAGLNALKKKFIVNYTRREEVDNMLDIKNDVVREVLKWFKIDYPMTISLTSDISSTGSGLASSSAYIMAMVNAINVLMRHNMTEYEICTVSYEIEKLFNPLVGQQDFYGSLSGGLKRINFFKNKTPSIEYISNNLWLDKITLISTGVNRSSTDVLSSINIDECVWLLDDVEQLHDAFVEKDSSKVFRVIRKSWINKKNTSNVICEHPAVAELDNIILDDENIYAHKLCGAGNGGFFLTFGSYGSLQKALDNDIIPIRISQEGLKIVQI